MPRVEYKISEVNSSWLEAVLLKKGARKVFEGEVFTHYYDRPSDNFIKSGKRISISNRGTSGTLSFKDKYQEAGQGISDEIIVDISNPEAMDKVMLELGFIQFKSFRKNRIEYEHGETILTFDKYLGDLDFIPEILMVEADNDEEVFAWCENLGYEQSSLEVISILELIKRYRKLANQVMHSINKPANS